MCAEADLSAGAASGASAKADVAQLAERVLGKDEVTSSILVIGSSLRSRLDTDRELRLGRPAAISPKRVARGRRPGRPSRARAN